MDEQQGDPKHGASLQRLLGYLNFSEGRPDAGFQKGLNEAYAALAGAAEPWVALHEALRAELQRLKAAGGAFQEATQAEAVLEIVFARLLPEYRRFHADLLFHQGDRDLFGPFFLARAIEAVLAQGGPWDEVARIVDGALRQLNDFVGYRPVALLETRPRGEPYPHERVRPVPLYIRGAGVACGRYHDLVVRGLEVLAAADRDLLHEAGFDLDLLDELALDPRAYDFAHPVNRRPNYQWGEWDPHHIDNNSRYRRYVARQVTLDGLLERVADPGPLDRGEALTEAAIVFAGTLLMATATSGSGPAAHDSTTTLNALVPQIARIRDAFYADALERFALSDAHGARLRQEAAALRQPFGGARQHLNAYLSQQRALQLQQRHLALLFAEMGYPDAAREEARCISAASVRLLSDILGRLTTGTLLVERGDLRAAAALLPEVEELLKRGIDCGALADPWNVLGFQGLFPISTAREDAVRDQRVHELITIVERLFGLYGRVLSESAAAGERELVETVTAGMKRLAGWWDRFATSSVSEVRPVRGAEAVASAEHVADALARWHQRGAAAGDLAFWRERLDGFQSPKAFALVVEALLRKADHRASMGLLINWLGQAGQEQVKLEDGEHSFHALALQWLLTVLGDASLRAKVPALLRRFFDYLEANAEDYWQVPSLETGTNVEEEEEDDLFGAAYEGVTYRDTTDDREGPVADGGLPRDEFVLEADAERLTERLQFLTTVARLWHVTACRGPLGAATYWEQACRNRDGLIALLDAVHACSVPEPTGAFDALVEYDRRRLLKEQLLDTIIGTCLETEKALGALAGAGGMPDGAEPPYSPAWGALAVRLEQAIAARDPAALRAALPPFLTVFQQEPLLYTPVTDGGEPRQVLRARLAQSVVRMLATVLPRLGLLRETYHVLKTARRMETAQPPRGRRVTEFNTLFETAYRGVVECIAESAVTWGPPHAGDEALVDLLGTVTTPFLGLWVEHSGSLQLSVLEQVRTEEEWKALRNFVRRYGRDLFEPRFLALANLRGILHRGVGEYLNYLRDNPDPLHPVRLIDDLGRAVTRDEAVARLTIILQAVVENYEEYKDFNSTAAQAAYGDNLYVLLDFLRLKASYQRYAWHFRPVVLAHEVLARKEGPEAALLWEDEFAELTRGPAADHLEALAELEREHRVRLATVADRLQERFVRPLALDRLCALIEPAMAEARRPGERPAFERLRRELGPLTAAPAGAGLDVPPWLRRLETEVQRVRTTHGAVAESAETLLRVPQRTISYEEMQQQMEIWETPLI